MRQVHKVFLGRMEWMAMTERLALLVLQDLKVLKVIRGTRERQAQPEHRVEVVLILEHR